MSTNPAQSILDGLRSRRDFYESRWREASAKSTEAHDEYMEAERALIRAEQRCRPVMAPAISLQLMEE